jgi:hypothetical protein
LEHRGKTSQLFSALIEVQTVFPILPISLITASITIHLFTGIITWIFHHFSENKLNSPHMEKPWTLQCLLATRTGRGKVGKSVYHFGNHLCDGKIKAWKTPWKNPNYFSHNAQISSQVRVEVHGKVFPTSLPNETQMKKRPHIRETKKNNKNKTAKP